jgi:hypothetical protein
MLVMAVGAVVALGYMAQRYGRLLDPGVRTAGEARPVDVAIPPEEAPAQVEEFVAVREAMRAEIDVAQDEAPDPDALLRVRDEALSSAGMAGEHYATLRAGYRQWLRGRLPQGTLADAFEVRRTRLERASLGRYEPLDL